LNNTSEHSRQIFGDGARTDIDTGFGQFTELFDGVDLGTYANVNRKFSISTKRIPMVAMMAV